MSEGNPNGMPQGFPQMPGMPGMDMEMLQQMMNDPNIRRMTEAISQDPVFQEMAKEMQEAMLSGGMDNLNIGGEGGQAPQMPGMDPNKYMDAFSRVMQNPEFMSAAENLGKGIMEQSMDKESLSMLQMFQNPENQAALKAKMEELKDDPELGEMMKDIEENGQAAMMKYMNDPEMMSKMGKKFQEAMADPAFRNQLKDAPIGEEEEEEEGEEPGQESDVIGAASAGSVDRLKQLLKDGADPDMKDEEGRTALHFASGYGELECMEALLDAGADINAVDENKNTALHYSAGYGNKEATELLVKMGVDKALKNAEDKTAKEVAEMNDQEDVAKLL
ncbi:hypothetical protein M9435_003244 [Picochlorum sp. BPE23]|nr:hypothetical protein M9435_003244 [Picochlorum sp. BPE23]